MSEVLKARNGGHNTRVNDVLRAEHLKAVETDPQAFDILLFRPHPYQ